MTSPTPWLDARAKITASGLLDPALIEWPNEPITQPDGVLWLSVRDVGESLMPIEMFGGVWQETGRLYLNILSPAGTGSLPARTLAKGLADVFRPTPVVPQNVVYYAASIGAGELVDVAGMWWPLTLTVSWRYQDVEAVA